MQKTRRDRSREHLTAEEVKQLLAAAKQGKLLDADKQEKNARYPERDYCLLYLLSRHGLRATEACNLKVSDVDLLNKTIFIRRLKNGKPAVQPIYNGGELKSLHEWIKIRATRECDNLFVSERREPLTRAGVDKIVRKYAEAAELEHLNIHAHMLRHSTGYAMANRGADTRLIQDYLGHQNIQNTVKYTALNPERYKSLTWDF
jgi:type 1 fimbriae regulatory protein FimB